MDLLTRQLRLSAQATFQLGRGAKSACVDARRNATPCIVDARSYPMTAVGFHRGAATAKSGKEKDRAKGE
jgi:hypothetical protein